MGTEPQLFRVDTNTKKSEVMKEVNFSDLGLRERLDIQEWVADNPSILGDDLIIIGKEFSGFDGIGDRLDLLAVDKDGRLVIIELKRDDSGTDAHWQAIKYASYFQHVKQQDIIRMFAEYRDDLSEEAAEEELRNHLNEDNLNSLNNDQRIVLASHRFAPQVTSAALWLNEKSISNNQVTCVKLTPYQEEEDGPLYLQANTIIPVPGAERFAVTVGTTEKGTRPNRSSLSDKMRAAKDWKKNDDITHFLRAVAIDATASLQRELTPNRKSIFATGHRTFRAYRLWYSNSPPWRNYDFCFSAMLSRESETHIWKASIAFAHQGLTGLQEVLEDADVSFTSELTYDDENMVFRLGEVELDDDARGRLAATLKRFIEEIKPVIDQLVVEGLAEVKPQASDSSA